MQPGINLLEALKHRRLLEVGKFLQNNGFDLIS